MKKMLAIVLCVALAVVGVGCGKKESPEQMEKRLTQKFIDAKSADLTIKASINANLASAGVQTFTLDSAVKLDINGNFPKLSFDGSMGVENLMTMPIKAYMDENGMVTSMLGQNQQIPIPSDLKAQFSELNSQTSNANANLSKTVEETDYNGQQALKINYDLNQINTLVSAAASSQASKAAPTTISKMDIIYVLKSKDEIQSIVLDLTTASGAETSNMHIEIAINSIGQPVEITPLSDTPATTPTTVPVAA